MSRNISAEAAASSAPRNGPSTYSIFSADSSEDLLDHLEDFPLVPDTSLAHATSSVPYEDATDSLKNAFLDMGTPVASATPGSSGLSFAHEQQVYFDQQSMPEHDGIERTRLDPDSSVAQLSAGRRVETSHEDNTPVSPHVLSPSSSTTSSSSSTPSTPQLSNVAVETRQPTFSPWDSATDASEMDGRHQGLEMAPSSALSGVSRSGPFIRHKRSNQRISRQGPTSASPTTASPSMPGTPNANARSRRERSDGSDNSVSLFQSQGQDRRRDVRDELTSALNILHAERRRIPTHDMDVPHDEFGPSTSSSSIVLEQAYAEPPSPTMTVFSSLDDDLLPDFLDLEGDDASGRLSHINSRPFTILPGVAEAESERSPLAHENVSHPRTTPLSKPVAVPSVSAVLRDDGVYADPVIPTMQAPPGPRKAQSLSNLLGPSRRAPQSRPVIQHSASSQRLYEHARSAPLGGLDFSKPLPMAPIQDSQQPDEDNYTRASSQRSQAASMGRRISPLSGLAGSQPPPAHLGIPSYPSESSLPSASRNRALSSVDMRAVDNAQQRLHHSASRESGFTGTEGSSRSRSSTTSSWDFVPQRKVDPAIPPELAASRIPGTPSMLSPPATRVNFSPTESSRPGVQRILQQHGIAGTRAEYSPTALSPTALSFDQSLSRRGSTRSASARSNKSSGSSQNAADGVVPRRRDEGSGLSDLRHKISGLLRPAHDLSPRSPEFPSAPHSPNSPGTPRRKGKGGEDDFFSASIGAQSMRSRGLAKKSTEQLAPPHSPRTNSSARQPTNARGAGFTSPQHELESFMPDELTEKPLKKKLFGGLGW